MNSINRSVFTLSLSIISVYIMSACKADRFEGSPLSSFSVTHAAPGGSVVDVLVDGQVTSVNRLSFGNTTISKSGSALIYLPAATGSRNIKVSTDSGKTSLIDVSVPFETGKIYSFFAMDTLVSSKLKVLRVNDDLTLPAAGMAHVRFLHMAPVSGAVDIVMTRGTDSITMANMTYIGAQATPDINVLSKFTPVPSGSYIVKVKTAGTQTVLTQTAAITLGAVKIYTFYAKGGAKSLPLTISTITNY